MSAYAPTSSPDYDFPVSGLTGRKLLFATVPRCGSHHICNTLQRIGGFGSPLEYFHVAHWAAWSARAAGAGEADPLAHLLRRRTGPNGLFSAKLHWSQLLHLDRLRPGFTADADWVLIVREDVLAQAVSWEIASQTGAFIHTQPAIGRTRFSAEAISKRIRLIAQEYARWTRRFGAAGARPFVIVYEQFTREPRAVAAALAARFRIEGTGKDDGPAIDPVLRQADRRKTAWRRRYLSALAVEGG